MNLFANEINQTHNGELSFVLTIHPGYSDELEESYQQDDATTRVVVEHLEHVHPTLQKYSPNVNSADQLRIVIISSGYVWCLPNLIFSKLCSS